MGLKKLFGRKIRPESRPIHQHNAGAHPVSHPLQNSGSNHIQDSITTPNQDQVPPIFDDLRTAAPMVDSDTKIINAGVPPFSISNSRVGGGSPSGSSGSTIMRRSNRVLSPDVIPVPSVIPRVSDAGSVDVIVEVPNNIIEDERQRLVREYTRAKNYWWWGFALDGAALTYLENCMELDCDGWTPAILEVSAGFVKMAYLICLRCLYFWGITSSKNMVAYFLFRCIGPVTIKYLSSFSTLKVLEQKFKLAIANLAAAPPTAAPNLPHVD